MASPWLILFLILVGNLALYWLFFGKKRFEKKLLEGIDDSSLERKMDE